jgi:hypothetical protein
MSEGPLSVMQLRSGGVRQSRRTNFTARRLLFGREIGWGGAGVPIPGTASACPASNHVVNTWAREHCLRAILAPAQNFQV